MGTYSGKHQVVLVGYIRAALMFFIVLMLGVIIAVLAHGYSLVDGLYWTIGCMTTAGDTLDAVHVHDCPLHHLLRPQRRWPCRAWQFDKIQVALFRRRRVARQLSPQGPLAAAGRSSEGDPDATMRAEADFSIIAVLRSRDLIDGRDY